MLDYVNDIETENTAPIPMDELLTGASEEVRRAIADMGYESLTPIQQLTIPEILNGRDIIGQAQTGTGKTAAYGIPLVDHVDPRKHVPQALVMCPTRELAIQVARELTKMSRYKYGMRVLPVYGGQPIDRQIRFLREGAQIIVGTPGRIIDHINRGTLKLDEARFVVLDEADEMLDMGFRDDIQTIMDHTPTPRQTLLFSATMPRPIMMLAQRYQQDPAHIKVAATELTVDTIEQVYLDLTPGSKQMALSRLLDKYDPQLALVFVNTKVGAEEVVTYLQKQGYAANALHGDMRQVERDNIMMRFRNGVVRVLVATDVAARGIDVKGIDAVINYDIPQDIEQYVHRIGRTGRAGKQGRAFTFVVGRELTRLWEIRRFTKAKILLEKAPLRSEITEKRTQRFADQLLAKDVESMDVQREWAEKLLAERDATELVAALLGMSVREADGPEDLTPTRAPRPRTEYSPSDRRPMQGSQNGYRGNNGGGYGNQSRGYAYQNRQGGNGYRQGGNNVRQYDRQQYGAAARPGRAGGNSWHNGGRQNFNARNSNAPRVNNMSAHANAVQHDALSSD